MQYKVGSDLFEVDHRDARSLELKDEMEFPLGGLGIVNQPDPLEVGIADFDGARQIGCTHAAKTQDDSRGLVRDLEGACNAVWDTPGGGDPKEGGTVDPQVRHHIDDLVCDLRFGFWSRG